MTSRVLEDGGPVVATADGERIGAGPWARWLASGVVPDEGTPRAERGRRLARAGAVSRVTVQEGSIDACVTGTTGNDYSVTLSAAPVPHERWSATLRVVRGRRELEAGAAGEAQSIHLAHLMATRFATSLAPTVRDVRRRCTCPDADYAGACKHVAAVAFAVADAIDRDPSLFLVWRGCPPLEPSELERAPWQAGALPDPHPVRALPPGAVLKRLGRSGIRAGTVDLTDALGAVYEAFAATGAKRQDEERWSSD